MLGRVRILCSLGAACLCLGAVQAGVAQINIPAERYDNARTGANLSETQLQTNNVNATYFGKVWSYAVSGSVQAQPLYLKAVTLPGLGVHNILYVATMNDVVYAFDADSSSNTPLWSVDLTKQSPNTTPVPITDVTRDNGLNIVGNVGIESTPVIDVASGTMYLVARTKEAGQYVQRLHALSVLDGTEKYGGSQVIEGSVPGTGVASVSGTLTFDPLMENQRASLALANGQVFIGWASHEDLDPYHGWVMSYNETSLQQTGIFQVTPSGDKGGIWMSGHAPAVDANNNVYYITGNGDWDGTSNFGESVLKFGSQGGLPLLDWFTPDNYTSLNNGDADLGASGPILIPGTDLLVGGGKQSIFYLMHTGSMGHEQSGNGQIVQSLSNYGGEIKGGPVYWNRNGGKGPWMYVWANGGDYLKAYHFNGATFDTAPVSQSTVASPSGASGGVLTLSANGSRPGTGIVWSSMPLADDGDHGVHQGVLRALNADDLHKELWNSNMVPSRDAAGLWPKFSPPLVANGRVYLASFAADGAGGSQINVYGLLHPTFSLAVSPASRVIRPAVATTYAISIGALTGFNGSVTLGVSGLPPGASSSFTTGSLPASSVLTVTTLYNTPIGAYPLTITAVSGTTQRTFAATLVLTSVGAGQGAISVDFVGNGTPMGALEVAGVVPRAHWNEATGSNSSAALTLLDETGTRVAATATWTSSGPWSLPISDAPGDVRMMRGYLDPLSGTATVTVSNLPASPQGYDVYVYADGDNGGARRTASYQMSSPGAATSTVTVTDTANTNFAGTFHLATNGSGNYASFVVSGTSFMLTATPGAADDGTQRAPVNGIQIVPRDSVIAGPVYSPAGGSYSGTQTVTIRDANPSATIYYTTNGATPTTASILYTGPISVGASRTVKAIAVSGGYTSLPSAAVYMIAKP